MHEDNGLDGGGKRYGLIDSDDPDLKMLVPLPGRPWGYTRHDNRDMLVVIAALGRMAKPMHADLYAEIKNSQVKRGDDSPRQYRVHNFARKFRCTDRTARDALHDLADSGIIEITSDLPWQLSPIDGNLYRWVADNWAERATDTYIRDVQTTVPESFRASQNDLAAGLALVAEAASSGKATEEATAKAAAMLAEVARLLGGGEASGGGGDGDGHDGPKPDGEPPKGGGTDPEAHEEPGPASGAEPVAPDDRGSDKAAESDDLPGYDILAGLDMRADKGQPAYQAEARAAYKALLADPFEPTPGDIAEAYYRYDRDVTSRDAELRAKAGNGPKPRSVRRRLGVWLSATDDHGARAEIRRIRICETVGAPRPRRDITVPDDSQYPSEAPCPRCGRPAKLLVHTGGMYECSNPECNEFGDEFGGRYQFRLKLE